MLFSRKLSVITIAALLLAPLHIAFASEKEPVATEMKTVTPAAPAPVAKPEIAKTSPTDPAAMVNGTPITRAEVSRAMKVLMAQNPTNQQLPPELLKQAEESTLDKLIAAELLYQEGAKREMKDLDKQVADKISQSKARYGNDFEKALKSADMTEKDLDEYTRKDVIINNLIQNDIAGKIAISDEEAKKFYTDNIDKFKQQESVKASHILIGVEPSASAEEKKKAREKAEGLLKKIKAGEDFAAVAKKESTCPSSAQGGDLGFFTKGQMVAPFEKAAFALKPGEMSDVVETQFGYHIIKVTEKKDAETVKFDDVKDKIKEYLKSQQAQKGISELITTLKDKAKIVKMDK